MSNQLKILLILVLLLACGSANNRIQTVQLSHFEIGMKAYENKEQSIQKGQEAYKCYYCGKWHRTSVSKGRRGKLKGFSFASV